MSSDTISLYSVVLGNEVSLSLFALRHGLFRDHGGWNNIRMAMGEFISIFILSFVIDPAVLTLL